MVILSLKSSDVIRLMPTITRLMLVAVALAGVCAAQQQPQFEVASVKLSPPGAGPGHMPPIEMMTGGPFGGSPSRLTIRNYPLRSLILRAWNLADYQLIAPGFLSSIDYMYGDRLDIDAVIPEGVTRADVSQMLQQLVIQRFDMKVHHETKDGTIRALVVAPTGHKLVLHDDAAPQPPPSSRTTYQPKRGTTFESLPDRTRFHFFGSSTSALAAALQSLLKCKIVDRTGLDGLYDFTLEWQKDSAPPNAEALGGGPGAPAPPDIPSALQSELGLKLISEKGTVDVLVVDQCNRRPTAN